MTNSIRNLKTDSILDSTTLEEVVNSFTIDVDSIWCKHSKKVNIMKHSKAWWDNNCQKDLDMYRQSKQLEDWKRFKETVKRAKHNFFDGKIDEIANKKCSPWELMNLVKKRKLPAIEAIQYNGCPYIKLEDLWVVLHNFFNSAQNCQIDIHLLVEIPNKEVMVWASFLKAELINAIDKCNNSLTPGLDKLSCRHLKKIVKNKECIDKLIDIANIYIDLGHWPSHFKTSTTVIISKSNKTLYDSTKSFPTIVLLNTTEKLFEKMIGEQLQFLLISNNFIHMYQLGGLKHRSTTDTGVVLTHFLQSGWVKSLSTSILAFDIAQFFPLLNHQLLPLILNKAGFNQKVSTFFSNYLVNRKTKYLWNNFFSLLCNVGIGIRQESALSPILFVLYLSLIFHILEKCLKILKIPISILLFVDNGILISQNKLLSIYNMNLFCSYNVILSLLIKFGLIIEYSKTEVFHFSRLHGAFNPSPLDLTSLRGLILLPKTTWRYLGFIFDHKLSFWSHIDFYAKKAISTIKYMKMLGNSSRGLILLQKR